MQSCTMKRSACNPMALSSRTLGRLRVNLVAPQTRRAAVVSRAGLIQKVTGEELEVAIAGRTTNMVIDFFATWCGPCVLLSSELEKVASELGEDVVIVKVDVDENQDLASQLKIEGLPTMVFIPKDGGKPALRTEGLLPYAQILDIVRDL